MLNIVNEANALGYTGSTHIVGTDLLKFIGVKYLQIYIICGKTYKQAKWQQPGKIYMNDLWIFKNQSYQLFCNLQLFFQMVGKQCTNMLKITPIHQAETQQFQNRTLRNEPLLQGMHGPPWEGEIEQTFQVGTGVGGIRHKGVGGQRETETGGHWGTVQKPCAVETSWNL